MGKIGKISTIKREFNDSLIQTMQSELSKRGMSRIPGTGVFKYPYKELGNKYRTGLDPNAAYIKRISDPTAREIEIDRVNKLRERLEAELGGLDLGPTSQFWNSGLSTGTEDLTHVQPVKLMDGDNYFDFSNPFKELEFAWLRVHPTIASSYESWIRGDFPAETQFYIVDDEVENTIIYKKKQIINKAIIKFDVMSIEKKRKVARLLGLPISDETKEEVVYNLVDNMLKQSEFKEGQYQGLTPVEVFTRFADMKDDLLTVKDLVKQALTHSVYRKKPNGKVYMGELEVATDEEELVKFLSDEDNQDELLILEQKIKGKKLAAV
jgi:hypothetical protein